MMSKVRFLTWAVAILALLNMGIIAFVLMRPHPPHAGPKKVIIERLQLNPAQVQQYEQLIVRHRSAIVEKEKEMTAAKQQLYTLLKQDSFSQKDALVDRIGQIQQQIEAIHFNHFQELKALCTPEQLPLFLSMTDDLAAYFAPPRRPK